MRPLHPTAVPGRQQRGFVGGLTAVGRRRRGRSVHGIVLLDKPAGISSNQAVQAVRRIFNAQKAGHTGTLDPFATGMLPVCLGEATKTAAFLIDSRKCYQASIVLGRSTTTGDPEGDMVDEADVPDLDLEALTACLRRFRGDQFARFHRCIRL